VHDAENGRLGGQMIFDLHGAGRGRRELIELAEHHRAAVVRVAAVGGADQVVFEHRHGVVVQLVFELYRRHLLVAQNYYTVSQTKMPTFLFF